tara:strand:- start:109 stop:1245 length:1137 start_codon:yes stop_codon:yes gene_type:complete
MSIEDHIHKKWMKRAIHLASLGRGQTSPNPMVGAVILDKAGKIISEGFHQRAGLPHAEAMAFNNLKSDPRGGTIYVNLEPCCHTGKTPPCVDKIISSGINKVFISMKDPDARVAGKGIRILKKAGLDVHLGICEQESLDLNKSFIYKNLYGSAYGVLKWAMSLDGRLGLKNGQSKWITNEKSRSLVHKLRTDFDAIIIGGNTLRKDNPLLNTRGLKKNEPLRVVLTRTLDLPIQSNLWDTSISKTLVVYDSSTAKEKYLDRIPKNVQIEKISSDNPKLLSKILAQRGCNKILWECGPELATSAMKSGCIQELITYLAPKILGGDNCMSPFSDFAFTSMNDVINLNLKEIRFVDGDLCLRSFIKNKINENEIYGSPPKY